ncbi:hypothetical protein NC653_000048 [Populus alba x Populus x berolinensis]|uniref:Uncharacterized protein n=1 Tax=Populus alba x Populus x berolinensis TaxID=444605 RepID=A0AAD6RHS2_9ROSI|nr:hypothetical protein NC653_000048 [Populus alba x Populus x berolinensis]
MGEKGGKEHVKGFTVRRQVRLQIHLLQQKVQGVKLGTEDAVACEGLIEAEYRCALVNRHGEENEKAKAGLRT